MDTKEIIRKGKNSINNSLANTKFVGKFASFLVHEGELSLGLDSPADSLHKP